MAYSTSPNSASGSSLLRQWLQPQLFWLLPILLGVLVPTVFYHVLPQVGVSQFLKLFSLKLFGLAVVGFGASIAYAHYFQKVTRRPWLILGFVACFWIVLNHANDLLMAAGLNIRFRLIVWALVVLPAVWLSLKNWRYLVKVVPHFKYYAFFVGWVTFYTFFYNTHATDMTLMDAGGGITAGALDIVQLMGYLYCLLAIAVAGVTVRKHPKPSRLFNQFNVAFLIVTGLCSIYTIIGYPLLLTSEWIDGFQRANGLFSHPNPFAHHMGIILIYQLGLFLYYQNSAPQNPLAQELLLGLGDSEATKKQTGLKLLLLVAFAFNSIAFLLALSKSAIAFFLVCSFALVMMNLSSPVVRKYLPRVLLAMVVLIPVSMVVYGMVTGQGFLDILESRMDKTESLNWRQEIWHYLLSNIHGWWIFTGHGFTDANSWVYQLTYNTEKNAKPLMMVHNGYIALLYDLGIMGLTFFVSVWVQLKHAARETFKKLDDVLSLKESYLKSAYSTVIALSLYFLMACGVDEMTYMFDAPILFWLLTTLLLCVSQRTTQELKIEKAFRTHRRQGRIDAWRGA